MHLTDIPTVLIVTHVGKRIGSEKKDHLETKTHQRKEIILSFIYSVHEQ